MLRAFATIAVLSWPGTALGWTFSPLPICTLNHAEAGVEITVTHDPAAGEYAITLTLAEGVWPQDAGAFHIAFTGGRALTIGTGFHAVSEDGRSLTVRDRGFDNVLDGLEFNAVALAWADATRVPFTLDGAAGPVQQFRACPKGLNLS